MDTADLVTQDELDALMDGRGGADGRGHGSGDEAVLPYALGSAQLALEELLPALKTIHQRLVHPLGNGLFELLHRDVEFVSVEVRICSYQEFVRELASPCSVNLIGLPPLAGPGLLVFDHPLVFALVGAYYGGQGTIYSESSRREFTAAENRLAQRLLSLCARALALAWKPYLPVQFRLLGHEINPHFVTTINTGEPLVVAELAVELDGTRGRMHIGLPAAMFEPVRRQILATNRQYKEHRVRDERLGKLLREGVESSKVEARCVLADVELSVRELLILQAGDVVPLDIPERAVLEVEGVALHAGHYGTARSRRSLKIERQLVTLPRKAVEHDEDDKS